MARRGTVLEFRKPSRKRLVLGPTRTDKLKFNRRSKTRIRTILALFAVLTGILFCILLAGERWLQTAQVSAATTVNSLKPLEVYWVDGDSGTIDGRPFRLHGIDAPEASPSRAECNTESLRANEARSAVRTLTDNGVVEIRKSHGIDKYNRELLSLPVDGRDVASSLIVSGHVKRWNFEAGDPKPRWCG